MKLDEMIRIARVAANGYPEDQEIYYTTFSQKTVKRLLTIAEAARYAVEAGSDEWGQIGMSSIEDALKALESGE